MCVLCVGVCVCVLVCACSYVRSVCKCGARKYRSHKYATMEHSTGSPHVAANTGTSQCNIMQEMLLEKRVLQFVSKAATRSVAHLGHSLYVMIGPDAFYPPLHALHLLLHRFPGPATPGPATPGPAASGLLPMHPPVQPQTAPRPGPAHP